MTQSSAGPGVDATLTLADKLSVLVECVTDVQKAEAAAWRANAASDDDADPPEWLMQPFLGGWEGKHSSFFPRNRNTLGARVFWLAKCLGSDWPLSTDLQVVVSTAIRGLQDGHCPQHHIEQAAQLRELLWNQSTEATYVSVPTACVPVCSQLTVQIANRSSICCVCLC